MKPFLQWVACSVTLACLAGAASAAERIVTLGGSITETIYALGGEDQLVARDASSIFPAAVHQLPDVGYFRTIGAEGVLALKPTLILAAFGTGPENQVELLKNSGVRFVHLESSPSADSTFAMIAGVGQAIGREREAAALVEKLRGQFAEAARLAARSSRRPTAVVLMGAGGGAFQAAFDATAGSAVVELAGGHNPFTGLKGYKAVSSEELVAADPDFIFIGVRDGTVDGAGFGSPNSPPAWLLATRAAQNGRLHTFDMTYYLVFGPRSGDAVLSLAKALHAEPAK